MEQILGLKMYSSWGSKAWSEISHKLDRTTQVKAKYPYPKVIFGLAA
jgi:hypothetical protein